MRTKNLIIITALAIAIGLAGCDLSWQQYNNKEYGFSILFPRAWKKEGGIQDIIVIAKSPRKGQFDKFQENANVVVSDLPGEMPLTAYFDLNKTEIMRMLPGAKYNVKESEIFAGSEPGNLLSFTCNVGDITLQITSAVWMKGQRVYVVTCSGDAAEYPKYEPTFNKIMHSLRIK